MRLKDVCTLKTGQREGEALFWLRRRGSAKDCGKPEMAWEFSHYHFGLTPLPSSTVKPLHLWGMLEYLWSRGEFARYAHGSLRLNNITKRDLLAFTLPIGDRLVVQLPSRRVVLPGSRYTLTPAGEMVDHYRVKLDYIQEEA